MALTPRLELKYNQSLFMTPQLQQAIRLLQMSNLDLHEYVETELAENPMLERDDSNSSAEYDGPDEVINEKAENGENPEIL